MDPERYQRVKSIFEAVREAPEIDRAAVLERRCSGHPALRSDVENLLLADGVAGDFLEPPDRPDHGAAFKIPQQIGPYRILETIGSGGMGVVLLAQEARPTRRKVAIKLIRPDRDEFNAPKRFEAEQRALALMDHPGIAKIFNAGVTEEGRPYFAMEHVVGTKLTDYCNQAALGIRGRLELLVKICEAVQHAHNQGVLHRDLKPSNILVKKNGGVAIPKIIDFGIARAIGSRQALATLRTQHGAIIGTPVYMSPEQADPLTPKIGCTSDVYSLGVILYELVTGVLPFEQGEAEGAGRFSFLAPSDRIEAIPKDVLQRILNERGTDERCLRRELRGLDRIVRQALHVDPKGRYLSAAELASDLLRHLKGGRATWFRSGIRKRTWTAAMLSGAVLLTLGVAWWRSQSADLIPLAVDVRGNSFVVVNHANEELWSKRFDSLNTTYADVAANPLGGVRHLIHDFVGDERPEVLFIEQSVKNATYLHAYDYRSRELWDAPFHFGGVDGLIDPDTGTAFGALYKALVIGIARQHGRPLIVAHSKHSRYPDRVVLLDADGSLVSDYVHPGNIYSAKLIDLDSDGDDELVLGATRNPGNAIGLPAVFVLDIPFEHRSSRDNNFFDSRFQMERTYLLFPTIEPLMTANVGEIRDEGETLEIRVHSLWGRVYYDLEKTSLKPIRFRFGTDFTNEARRRVRNLEHIRQELDQFARFDTAPRLTDEEIARRFQPIGSDSTSP